MSELRVVPVRRRWPLRGTGFALMLSCLMGAACCAAAGTGLGLYLGAFAVAMIIAPPIALAARDRTEAALSGLAVVSGIAIIWGLAAMRSETTPAQWLAACALLAAGVAATIGVALALERLHLNPPLASAITVTLALAWLTCPIWLSAWVDRAGVADAFGSIVRVHPLLALNGVVAHLGIWGEQPLMYQLTALGQDVPYRLPATIFPAAITHALIGAALLLIAHRWRMPMGRDGDAGHARRA